MRPRLLNQVFGAVVAVSLLVVACGGGGESSSATSSPGTTSVLDATTAVVVAFYSASNVGDVEEMTARWPTGDVGFFRVLVEGLRQKTSLSCTPSADGDSVVCQETFIRNDFYGPAGVAGTVTVNYEIAEGVIVNAEVIAKAEAFREYESAFGDWLATADPALYSSSYLGTGRFPFETPEAAQAILARIDDFLATSDIYPLDQ